MSSSSIGSMMWFNGILSEWDIKVIASGLTAKYGMHSKRTNSITYNFEIPKYAEGAITASNSELIDLVYERQIPLSKIPRKRIIKMCKKQYLDDFFNNGNIQLGCFDYYQKIENPEICDKLEGLYVVVGLKQASWVVPNALFGRESDNAESALSQIRYVPAQTFFAALGDGNDYFSFCTFIGDPDVGCLNKFGYDACYEITDVEGFSTAIASSLGTSNRLYSSCFYSKDKVVVTSLPPNFNLNVISGHINETISAVKYFLKPMSYAHQSEFRFLWRAQNDVKEPRIISCPEAVQYCKRVDL